MRWHKENEWGPWNPLTSEQVSLQGALPHKLVHEGPLSRVGVCRVACQLHQGRVAKLTQQLDLGLWGEGAGWDGTDWALPGVGVRVE